MTREEILADVQEFIRDISTKQNLKSIVIKEGQNIKNDIGLDSLDMVEVWILLCEKYEIDIPEDDVKVCDTITKVIDLVMQYKK